MTTANSSNPVASTSEPTQQALELTPFTFSSNPLNRRLSRLSDDNDQCQAQLLDILALLNEIDEGLVARSGRKRPKRIPRSLHDREEQERAARTARPSKRRRKRHRSLRSHRRLRRLEDDEESDTEYSPHFISKAHIHLNVGGRHFEIDQSTLLRVPNSRLYHLAEAHFGHQSAPLNQQRSMPILTCQPGQHEGPTCSTFDSSMQPLLHHNNTALNLSNMVNPLSECTCQGSPHDPPHEYFFDRHPGAFEMILSYYRTGRLHCPLHLCGPMFQEELQFWGINDNLMEACCWTNYRTYHNAEKTFASLVKDDSSDEEVAEHVCDIADNATEGAANAGHNGHCTHNTSLERKKKHLRHNSSSTSWRRVSNVVHDAFEQPQVCGPISMGLAIISIIIRVFSVALMAIQTLENYRVQDRAFPFFVNPASPSLLYNSTNSSSIEPLPDITETPPTPLVSDFLNNTDPHPWITACEIVIALYFALELVLRFLFCKAKSKFARRPLNWFDLMALLGSVTGILVDLYHVRGHKNILIQILHIPKIFRLFRLTRFMSGLKILLYTARASMRELFLMVVIFFIFVVFFGSAAFLAEQLFEDKQSQLRTLPHAFWWALVTMTTLGYGDIVPQTAPGYVVGMLCAMNGILVIALPVPIVVNNFALFYSHEVARRSMPKDRRKHLYRQQQQQQQQNPHRKENTYKPLMLTKYTAPAVASSTVQLAGSAVHL